MRSIQRKTHIIDISTALGQNAVSISSNPVLNQNVNVNINSKPYNGTSETPTTDSTIESINSNEMLILIQSSMHQQTLHALHIKKMMAWLKYIKS